MLSLLPLLPPYNFIHFPAPTSLLPTIFSLVDSWSNDVCVEEGGIRGDDHCSNPFRHLVLLLSQVPILLKQKIITKIIFWLGLV
jgi:hypothetical protein